MNIKRFTKNNEQQTLQNVQQQFSFEHTTTVCYLQAAFKCSSLLIMPDSLAAA